MASYIPADQMCLYHWQARPCKKCLKEVQQQRQESMFSEWAKYLDRDPDNHSSTEAEEK